MFKTGLISLNGIPGSGKTLISVVLAKRHYKKENSSTKKFISFLKYKILILIDKIPFIDKIRNIKNKIKKISNIKIIKILLKILNYFIKLILIICLFVNFSYQFKAFIIFYLFFFKKMIKSFNKLDYEYYFLFPHQKINNVYSTFPILLDKKNNIWSNKISLFDLDSHYSFYPGSLIIIDEVQLFVDSDEYKDKEKNKIISKIAKFLQAHRHFGIKQIIYITQNPSRIFKKARNITVGYLKLFKIIKLPFDISIARGIMYFDFEYYGRYIPKSREERKKLPFEYKKVCIFFRRSKTYSSYDSTYLSLYNFDKPLINRGCWTNYKVDKNYLETMFEENN